MRVYINLAVQPFEETRRFYARWRMTLAGVAIVVGLLVFYAAYTWYNARSVTQDIASLRQQEAALEQRRQHAQEIMNAPPNREVRDESQAINGMIVRKAFSWTLVFSDLEKIVPPSVRVVSIRPELKNSELRLDLKVQGGTHENVLVLLRRMEESRRFRNPTLKSESMKTAAGPGAPPAVSFDISAIYVPAVPGTAAAATDQGGGQ